MRIQKLWLCIILLTTSCIPGMAQGSEETIIPTQFVPPSPLPQPTPTSLPTDRPYRTIWLDPALPVALAAEIQIPDYLEASANSGAADFNLTFVDAAQSQTTWVYALVAPFPTLLDDVSQDDLRQYWRTGRGKALQGLSFYLDSTTKAAFSRLWGDSFTDIAAVVPAENILTDCWDKVACLAIIPFEQLTPRWKVIQVDGRSPLDRGLDLNKYPLVIHLGVKASPENQAWLENKRSEDATAWLPGGNRDESKLTNLVMTGVTALTPATGAIMDKKGTTYPGKDIRMWLRSADILHISNEVSFSPDCPMADPNQPILRFCSRPEYMELLQDMGVDVLELSGNHLHDWSMKAFLYSLDLYRQLGIPYYDSGMTLEEARQPITLTDHGNRLAFIGCNPAGPDFEWATEYTPGVASCDYDWMKSEIARLSAEGYLTIATQQYYESYNMVPGPQQRIDFIALADAGAVIVSGSQAHAPQGMGFSGDHFIHYGLGNLFFDQMDYPVKGTRREFIDRHTFYDGKYLSVELLTAMLEEYARPRPMTPQERKALLEDAFSASGW